MKGGAKIYFYSSSAPATTLSASLSSVSPGSTGSVEVASITGLPTNYPFTLIVDPGASDAEVVTITQAATGSGPYTFANSVRGDDGTSAPAHASGTVVWHGIAARDFYKGGSDWVNVLQADYGADPAGSNDSASALNAAITALGGNPGTVYVPAGTYKLESATVGPLVTGQYISCAPGVTFNWYGTGACFRWVDTSTYNSRTTYGGGLLGFAVIDGTNGGTGSYGVHAGDILQFRLQAFVRNFAGTANIGLYFDNQNYWTEQASVRAYLDNCTSFVTFSCGGGTTSTGSFDRGDFSFYLNQYNVGFSGVSWLAGASQTGGRVRVMGNFETAGTVPASSVLTVSGTVPAGHTGSGAYSGLSYCELDVNVEADEGLAYAPQTINFGAAGNYITGCTGNLSFGAANAFQESNSAGTSQFAYLGNIEGDTTLSAVFPNRSTFDGQVFFNSSVSLNGLTGATAGCRLVGAIASGTAPTSGTFDTGDMIIVRAGGILVCTDGGTSGTWVSIT